MAWLGMIGHGEYAPLFKENDVVGEELLELGMSDLASLGIRKLLPRKQLYTKIKQLAAVG